MRFWNLTGARRGVVPGFGISLGYTVMYLSVVVLLPLGALVWGAGSLGWGRFWQVVVGAGGVSIQRAVWTSFLASLLAAAANVPLGLLTAWVLVRYTFPGRRVLDALIDLPFAIPTAVAGIALASLYGPHGWVGGALAKVGFGYPWPVWVGFDAGHWGWTIRWFGTVSRAPLGVAVALLFVGLPFVVRTLQPVLEDLSPEVEEAAGSLGASRAQTFWKVILPQLRPAALTGFSLALARGLGEYGSVVFITGGNPDAEIPPQIITQRLEGYDFAGATAVAVVLLGLSFGILLGVNLVQRRWR